MTRSLVPDPSTPHGLLCQNIDTPLPQFKDQRGHCTKRYYPQESAPDADTYMKPYTSFPLPVPSFTPNRRIIYHDSAALEAPSYPRSFDQLLRLSESHILLTHHCAGM